ncbi:MAG: CBS domain-containing protein [Bacteroidota bacterium]
MKKVKEVMIDSPFYCLGRESLQLVAKQMSAANINSLPVVDKNNKVIGILGELDICMAFSDEKNYPLSDLLVENAMQREVFTCSPDDNLADALRMMRENRVGRLVVEEEETLIGIITLAQVVKKLYGTNEESMQDTGKENVLKTLYTLAENKPKEFTSVSV